MKLKRALPLLLLAALPALPARAEDTKDAAKPLREAQTLPLGATPLERAKETVETLSRFVPPTSKLVPHTNGKVRLAVLLVELADCPRPKYDRQAWQDMLFSKAKWTKDPDGRAVHGSVHDYYDEQSAGNLDLDGKVFDWVTIPAKRKEIEGKGWYAPLAKRSVLNAALDRLVAREGRNVLDGFDGLGFLVAGDSGAKWGTVLWPHSNVVFHGGKVWRYYLSDAVENGFPTIGVHAHEIGHVLGLPDEYGLQGGGSGIYCLMAVGNAGGAHGFLKPDAPVVTPVEAIEKQAKEKLGELRGQIEKLLKPGGGIAPATEESPDSPDLYCLAAHAPYATASRPLHICAPCKAALGWVKPVCVKPGQRLYLESIEDHPRDVIALSLGGSKRLLLEYRSQKGYDAGLPRSGLLAWRTGDLLGVTRDTLALGANGALVPAHGVASVDAAMREGVQWPWNQKTRLQAGRLLVDHIEERDGRVYFEINEGE